MANRLERDHNFFCQRIALEPCPDYEERMVLLDKSTKDFLANALTKYVHNGEKLTEEKIIYDGIFYSKIEPVEDGAVVTQCAYENMTVSLVDFKTLSLVYREHSYDSDLLEDSYPTMRPVRCLNSSDFYHEQIKIDNVSPSMLPLIEKAKKAIASSIGSYLQTKEIAPFYERWDSDDNGFFYHSDHLSISGYKKSDRYWISVYQWYKNSWLPKPAMSVQHFDYSTFTREIQVTLKADAKKVV